MRLSIIVPIYNTETYLKECVESILNQTFKDFELILVDDGSTDSCYQLCEEYSLKYDCVKVIHQENKGLLLARRAGISVAIGDYIMHVDSDDYLLPGALQQITYILIKYPCDLLFFDYISGESSNTPEKRIKIREEEVTTVFSTEEQREKIRKQLLIGGFLGSLCIKVTKRELIDNDIDYSPWRAVSNGEDYFQSFPIVDRAQSFVYLPEPLYYYRRDNESMSKKYGEKDFESFRLLYLRRLEYAKKWGLFSVAEDKLRYNYWNINMVIMRDVYTFSKNSFSKYLIKICNDDIFIESTKNLNVKNLSRYYQIMRQLILHKMFVCIETLMFIVRKRK